MDKTAWLILIFIGLNFIDVALCQVSSTSGQQIQCWACGLPKVNPENDIAGSYGLTSGKKRYNHSCDEVLDAVKSGEKIDHGFLRTCPVGVKSCFGAIGYYDHRDNDPANDLRVTFLGCSEAKHKHSYGCDREFQNVQIRDKSGDKMQVEIEVTLCFCSSRECNHPNKDPLASASKADRKAKLSLVLLAGLSFVILGTIFDWQ